MTPTACITLEVQKCAIDEELTSLVESLQTLKEPARYALFGKGKRLRPILTLTTVLAMGGDLKTALRPACALELIHTYSLIHDDLPCIDNDDYRRGRLTLHRKFGEDIALLTGDLLLTYAFEALATAPFLDEKKKVALIQLLAKSCGANGMIGGQVQDIASEQNQLSLSELVLRHRQKTGALITAAVEFGAILSEAKEAEQRLLSSYGEAIGLAFQVIDDILDVTHSQDKHGRSSSTDERNNKATFVSLLGLDEASRYADKCLQTALDSLAALSFDTSQLAALAYFVVERRK